MRKIAPRRFNWPGNILAVILCVFLSYVLFGTTPVHALDPNLRLTQYMHKSWGTQDGSLPAAMSSITQTSDGFLWFSALSQGIYRFDGVRFVPRTLPTHDKAMSTIVNVYGDRAGGLWALGERDIVHLNNGVVTSRFNLDGLQSFEHISEDPDGSLWVVRGGAHIADAPLCRITDQAVKCFGKSDGVPISPADSLLPDGKGGFWLGGQTGLVHWHDGVSETYPIKALNSNAGQQGVVSLACGPDGTLWVGILAEGPGLGLGRLIEGIAKPFVTPTFDGSKVVVNAMLFDRDGNLWVGTVGKGLFRIRGNVVDRFQHTDGLSGDSVLALFEDREGIVWTVTTNGIDSFRDPRITIFSAREGLGADAAAGVLASRDGTIWVANAGSLDHIKNGTISSIRATNGLPGHQVSYLLEDRAGKLWVGVDDGLYLFENGSFRRLPQPSNRPLGMVVALTEDIDGNIWAECASKPRKFVRIRDFRVQEEFPESKLPPGHSLASDPHGGIWIATLKGDVGLFRNGALEMKFPLNPGGDPFNRKIMSRADGSILAASENGLVEWRQEKVQRMTSKNGLPCNSVISFMQDDENRWWLHTGCGVVEFPDSELQHWRDNPETIVQTRVFDVLDGARPTGWPSFNTAAYSADGRVWFATGFVVEMVDSSRLSQKSLPAQTYIESLIADRKEVEATPNLRVPPNPRDLQINYTSPSFSVPQKVNFRYRLDSYDRDWHDAGTRRQAFYTDLPPGKYSFRVVASNSDGVWSESTVKLDFSVTPAYYQTNWFRALCMVIFMGLLLVVYQWRVRHLRHEFEMTLETRVSERTRIARELHDSLLQSFHGLLLRFQTVFQLLPERPMEAKEKLGSAIEQTADAITEGRDAVQGLRDSTVQGNDLALAISTLGEELAADSTNHRPAFRVAVEGEARNLHPILRDEIYKIAAEALRNAFRHSRARQIEVEIRYDAEQFRLRVRDDGKGVDPAILSNQGSEGHYGLPGMRERATLIGGKLVVWSEVGEGTEVELRVPASTAYATDRKSSWLLQKFAGKTKA
jgi:signal transduction histidine kinase/ligand-binding sensor domain-containing protein